MIRYCSVDEAVDLLSSPDAPEECSLAHGCGALVVEGDEWPEDGIARDHLRRLEWLPCVTVATGTGPSWRRFDVAADSGSDGRSGHGPDLDPVVGGIVDNPEASVALVRLLRAATRSDPDTALWAESVVYGLLQGGTEFAAWRRSAPARPTPAAGGAVRVERTADGVEVVLAHPARHNALGLAMRDQLVDGLRAVAADGTDDPVLLRGEGPSFCSGGDLGEFGTFPDPVTAHLVRSTRLPARAVLDVRRRLTVHVHGSCVGAGVELAAFAATVVAASDATFRLPEVSMGLVPGSGGTWSVPARIGRQRTAWLALSGRTLDAATALDWGLVDRIHG